MMGKIVITIESSSQPKVDRSKYVEGLEEILGIKPEPPLMLEARKIMDVLDDIFANMPPIELHATGSLRDTLDQILADIAKA